MRNRSVTALAGRTARRRVALALLLLLPLILAACGDVDDDVGSGTDTTEPAGPGTAEPAATFDGTITEVTATEPVVDDCVPAGDVDPDGAVSSDGPPICSDPDTLPRGSILVEVEPGVDGGEKISFTILQDTELTRDGEPIGFEDLEEGAEAVVGFDGQVAESYPGQATAQSVDVRAR